MVPTYYVRKFSESTERETEWERERKRERERERERETLVHLTPDFGENGHGAMRRDIFIQCDD